jgi:hypothetical protein
MLKENIQDVMDKLKELERNSFNTLEDIIDKNNIEQLTEEIKKIIIKRQTYKEIMHTLTLNFERKKD